MLNHPVYPSPLGRMKLSTCNPPPTDLTEVYARSRAKLNMTIRRTCAVCGKEFTIEFDAKNKDRINTCSPEHRDELAARLSAKQQRKNYSANHEKRKKYRRRHYVAANTRADMEDGIVYP